MSSGDLTLPPSVTLRRETVSLRAKLANGSSCEVYKAVKADSNEAALKIVPIPVEHPSLRARFLREVECLKRVAGQPNIVRMLDYREDDKLCLGLILEEFCSQGSLKEMYIRQDLTDAQLLTVFKDVCCGLCQIHNRGIAHRDLRPCNILIGNDFRCRLADFSSATTTFHEALSEGDLQGVLQDIETNTAPVFRAPEQLFAKVGVSLTHKVDMWGLGCLIYGMLFREAPFHAGSYKPPTRDVSEFWIHILNVLFVPDPHQRASAEEVLSMCIQCEIPKFLTATSLPTQTRAAASISDFFKTSTDSWVKAATQNFDAPPDPHYVSKLLSKAWQKPFKICKFYQSLQKRPLYKTRVAIKALMLAHLYVLHGPSETLSLVTTGVKQFLTTIDATWHPHSRQPFDDLHCDYFAGLIRQYSKVLKLKLALHHASGLQGEWRGRLRVHSGTIDQMLTYWLKLINMTSGLLIDVSQLPQVRAGLAKLLMQEKLQLMRVLTQALCELVRVEEGFELVPEMLTRFQQAYQQTRTLAQTLKRLRPLLSFQIPNEELPEDLAKLVDSRRKPKLPDTGMSTSPRVLVAEDEILNYISQFESKQELEAADKRKQPESSSDEKPPQAVDLLDLSVEVPATNGVDSYRFPKAEFSQGLQTSSKDPVPVSEPEQSSSLQHYSNPYLAGIPASQVAGFPEIVNPLGEAWVVKAQDLQFGPVLGMGASCTVFRGVYKRTPIAIKVMKAGLNADMKKEFSREISALLRIRHPNLVLFMGACLEPQMSILTEFCAGKNLFHLLHEKKNVMLSWKQRVKMCKDIAHGMHYLHDSVPPILHRDLKSLNLLLYEPVNSPNDPVFLKITDFGISRVMGHDALMTGQMGTCHWMAPEVLSSQQYGLPADVYSYGIVLWEIASRETPYQHLPPLSIPERVVRHGERPSLSCVPSACPTILKDLMVRCWHADPRRRPTFTQILDELEAL